MRNCSSRWSRSSPGACGGTQWGRRLFPDGVDELGLALRSCPAAGCVPWWLSAAGGCMNKLPTLRAALLPCLGTKHAPLGAEVPYVFSLRGGCGVQW